MTNIKTLQFQVTCQRSVYFMGHQVILQCSKKAVAHCMLHTFKRQLLHLHHESNRCFHHKLMYTIQAICLPIADLLHSSSQPYHHKHFRVTPVVSISSTIHLHHSSNFYFHHKPISFYTNNQVSHHKLPHSFQQSVFPSQMPVSFPIVTKSIQLAHGSQTKMSLPCSTGPILGTLTHYLVNSTHESWRIP